MTPPSMESIFLILSGVILVAGVLYWLWSHIQLTQKKVQLLENAVFELRGMLANSGGGAQGPGAPGPSSPTRQVQVVPSSAATAAALEQMTGAAVVDANEDTDNGWEERHVSTPLDALDTPEEDALQPGGCAVAAASSDEEREERGGERSHSDDFRRLFTPEEATSTSTNTNTSTNSSKSPEPLESMPVKELRRLAEQRGIAGAADMRKKEILAALRQQVTVSMTLPESVENGDVKEINIDASSSASSTSSVTVDTTEILE